MSHKIVWLDGRDERDGRLSVRDGVGGHGRDLFAHAVVTGLTT